MNFIVLGTSKFTIACAQALLVGNATISALISMPVGVRPINSVDIEAFAKNFHIDYFETSDINSSESLAFLREKSPDYVLSTWPRLIGNEVLAVPRCFVVGSHPADLPRNRGRHPLHWTIDLGIKETKLTFFIMDQAIDSGDILLQVPIKIDESDSIVDLNEKVFNAAGIAIQQLLACLSDYSNHPAQVQDHKAASFWRKRTPFDVIIDFRMPANNILQTIRSFIPPYPAAKIVFRDHIIKIVEGKIILTSLAFGSVEQIEPGKILDTDDYAITVKSADKIIWLISPKPLPLEIRKAKYIHPPAKYFSESSNSLLPYLNL